MVLRHLQVERDQDMKARLELFLREAVGNSYGMTTSKLLFHRPSMKPKHGTFVDDERSFFCSELVAKAYKVLGLI